MFKDITWNVQVEDEELECGCNVLVCMVNGKIKCFILSF